MEDDDWDGVFRHDQDNEFCHHPLAPDPLTESDPYSEDGYCCWCGNGSWKSHMYGCLWADTREGVNTAIPPIK